MSGIEKIQNNHNIRVTFESEAIEKDFVVIKATAVGQHDAVQSYGSAIKGAYPNGNVTHSYLVEMAEKRAKARSVLKLCGAYKYGIKSEDERMMSSWLVVTQRAWKILFNVLYTPSLRRLPLNMSDAQIF